MSEPSEPDKTETFITALNEWRAAVAQTFCADGYVVVRTDDLRAMLDAWKNDGRIPTAIYDRLRMIVGEA